MSELDDVLTTKVLVVTPDGKATVKRLNRRLESWQAEIGGLLENLTLSDDVGCFLNDEGKLIGLPINPAADVIIRLLLRDQGRSLMPGDHIVGPVVFHGGPDNQGYERDVPDWLLDWFRQTNETIVFTDLEET